MRAEIDPLNPPQVFKLKGADRKHKQDRDKIQKRTPQEQVPILPNSISGQKVTGQKVSGQKVSGRKVSGQKIFRHFLPHNNRQNFMVKY
jgi:hypothetical protein